MRTEKPNKQVDLGYILWFWDIYGYSSIYRNHHNSLSVRDLSMVLNSQLLLLLLLSCFSSVRLCVIPQTAAHQAPWVWDSPGKNTGVGCHFLLQWMKVKSESEVTQSCPTLSNPMDCSPPGSSIHGIFQARVLEWGAVSFSAKDGEDIYMSICLCIYIYISRERQRKRDRLMPRNF